jgi:tetratricopeptide (TPR) repeat protein
MKRSRIILFVVLMAFAVAGHGVTTQRVQEIRRELPAEQLRAQALMVNPDLLKIISGEFKGLLADYLLLKASVFLGGAWETTAEDWEAIALMFKQSLVLDPFFFQTGYYIQGNLAWRQGMHAKAVDLLELHADHRDWDWEPRFYVGFDYFYYLRDAEQAATHFNIASAIPGAPPIVGTLGARLLHRSSQTEAAITMLKAMYQRTDNPQARQALSQRLQAYQGVHVIEHAISQYMAKFDHPPGSLDELLTVGILDALPVNPLGDTFHYEPDSGRVNIDSLN